MTRGIVSPGYTGAPCRQSHAAGVLGPAITRERGTQIPGAHRGGAVSQEGLSFLRRAPLHQPGHDLQPLAVLHFYEVLSWHPASQDDHE